LNKAAIKQTLAHLPANSKVVIDAAGTVYIDYDVLMLIRDFVNFGSKDKNISVTLRNFKPAYKMQDAIHVHSEKTLITQTEKNEYSTTAGQPVSTA
jgi:hypothetical protein